VSSSIKGHPLLEIWLERLTEAGIRRFDKHTLLAEQVEAYIKSTPIKAGGLGS